MLEIASREEFRRHFLQDAPILAASLATRCGLRILPRLHPALLYGIFPAEAVLTSFRAIMISDLAIRAPEGRDLLSEHAESAAHHARRVGIAIAGRSVPGTRPIFVAAHCATMVGSSGFKFSAAADAIAQASGGGGQVWDSVSRDGDVLRNSKEVDAEVLAAELSAMPIWDHHPPNWFSAEWKALKSGLLGLDQGWDVWTDWYEDRLAGRTEPEALALARATISGADWEKDPAHVNAIIAGMIQEHTAEKFPARRIARLDPAGPMIALAPQDVADPALYTRVCDQVRETLALFPPRERTNLYSELGDVFGLLDGALSDASRNPITVHRRLAQSALEVARLLTLRDYLRDDFKVRTLADDLHEALSRIPDAVPVVAEEIARRMPLAVMALGAEDLSRLRAVLTQVLAVSTEEAAEFARPGLPVLERRAEGETLTDEHERMVVFALGWWLFDVSRLNRDLNDLRARYVQGSEQISHVSAAITAASQIYPLLLRLLQ